MKTKTLKPRLITLALNDGETNTLMELIQSTLESEIELSDPCYSYIKTIAGIADKIEDEKHNKGWN